MDTHSTLGTGIFTVPEAARLLQVTDTKMRGWIEGYRSARVGPLIEAEIEKHGRSAALSFANLMEVRFIDAFVQLGVHVRTIRAILEEARTGPSFVIPIRSRPTPCSRPMDRRYSQRSQLEWATNTSSI
jgi:hypothetical protein